MCSSDLFLLSTREGKGHNLSVVRTGPVKGKDLEGRKENNYFSSLPCLKFNKKKCHGVTSDPREGERSLAKISSLHSTGSKRIL